MIVTDEMLHVIITEALRGRSNASKRARIVDARAALGGSVVCRERFAAELARTVILPADLVDAIERYAATDWKSGRDPSNIGALNAVAYIGERLVAIVAAKKGA